eukprot:TRINITY_DN736_c0_g1_i3.p1 TRINITY_DN736_c0_g1~~TRINITY_DN736_c0_g1_i3.p1  ORF type:complete len:560 (+),score=78.75 TRINITY_DN736_c0_g1_i3:54-1682(+)
MSGEAVGDAYTEVSFQVPLLRREHKLTFFVGRTISESDGCIKTKLAHDDQRNEFMMKLVIRDQLEELPNAPAIEDFINTELAVLKLLDHRYIAKLFQVLSTDEVVYILMERCSAQLSQLLKTGIDEDQAKVFFQQLVEGVSYLHTKGLAHRFISPSSVLLDEDQGAVKLADFGFACVGGFEDMCEDRPEVVTRSACAAPELRSGSGSYNGFPCDVYALGATLHAMLVGKPPVDGSVSSEVPEDAKPLILSCLQKDPDQRPSVHALAEHRWVTGMAAPEAEFGAALLVTRSPESPRALQRDDVRRSFHKIQSGLQLDVRRASRASSICDELSPRSDLASPRGPRQRLPDTLLLCTPGDIALEPLQMRSAPDFSLSPRGSKSGGARSKMRDNLQVDVFGHGIKKTEDRDVIYDVGCDFVASPMAANAGRKKFGMSPPLSPPPDMLSHEEYLREKQIAALFEGALHELLQKEPSKPLGFLAVHFSTANPVPTGPFGIGQPEVADKGVKYLRDHGLPAVIASAVEALVQQRPDNPRTFLASHFGRL